MVKRKKNTKIGDVFVVQTSDTSKRYFQYIVSDLTQLNSDVIRVFKSIYPINVEPSLSEIIYDEVDFYAHTTTIAGVNLGLWKLYGNIAEVGDIETILFCDTNDYGDKSVSVSERWVVWNIGKERKYVGKWRDEFSNAEYGLIYAPKNIIKILQGIYVDHYPKFE